MVLAGASSVNRRLKPSQAQVSISEALEGSEDYSEEMIELGLLQSMPSTNSLSPEFIRNHDRAVILVHGSLLRASHHHQGYLAHL
jgi:hypothetical protein